tara:strand:- start:3829 stop:4920 length:1092 start_codon:yes stop_codon:yes gene_type:complete
MAIKWQTPSGILATIQERELYEQQLSATDSGTLTYSIHAGELPSGLDLTRTGKITGFANEVSFRTEKTFVVRVTNGTDIADRTFTLFVEGSDAPTWVTAAGTLDTVYDGQYVDIQLEVTDVDTPDSTAISYDIIAGNLPSSLSLSSTGRITGVISQIPEDAFDSAQLGFDVDAFDYSQPFDLTLTVGSIDRLWEFTVRATDGITFADRKFALDVRGTSRFSADTIEISADTTSFEADLSDRRGLYFTQSGIIATLVANNYHIVRLTVVDPDEALGTDGDTTISYQVVSGSLPPGMSIDSETGTISGIVGNSLVSFTDYTFTVRATKTSTIFAEVFTDQSLTIRITGKAFEALSWVKPEKEFVI